jgi:hypothetical protein
MLTVFLAVVCGFLRRWRVNEKLGLSIKDVNFIKIYIYIICGNLLLTTTTYKFVLFIEKLNEN